MTDEFINISEMSPPEGDDEVKEGKGLKIITPKNY